jgi:DNA-binding transcriptional LysR family regulator
VRSRRDHVVRSQSQSRQSYSIGLLLMARHALITSGLGYAVEPPSFWAPFRGIALLDITPRTTTVTYYLSYRASDDSPLVLALVDATTSSGLSGTA